MTVQLMEYLVAGLLVRTGNLNVVDVDFDDNLAAYVHTCICFKDLKSKTYDSLAKK